MINFTTSNGNGTITLSYTAPLAKIQSLAESAAEFLFARGYGDHGTEEEPLTFDDLTNTQKLEILDQIVKEILMNYAKTGYIDAEIETARLSAIAQAAQDFQL